MLGRDSLVPQRISTSKRLEWVDRQETRVAALTRGVKHSRKKTSFSTFDAGMDNAYKEPTSGPTSGREKERRREDLRKKKKDRRKEKWRK